MTKSNLVPRKKKKKRETSYDISIHELDILPILNELANGDLEKKLVYYLVVRNEVDQVKGREVQVISDLKRIIYEHNKNS